MIYFQEAISALNKNKVDYIVVGGIAVNLHGIPRFTIDLDLLVDFKRENVLRLVNTLTKLDYRPRVPVDPRELANPKKRASWIKQKDMKVFSFYHPKEEFADHIDIVVKSPVNFKEADRKKKIVLAGNIYVPILSINHLIKMKEKVRRKQDISDVEALKRLEVLQRYKE